MTGRWLRLPHEYVTTARAPTCPPEVVHSLVPARPRPAPIIMPGGASISAARRRQRDTPLKQRVAKRAEPGNPGPWLAPSERLTHMVI